MSFRNLSLPCLYVYAPKGHMVCSALVLSFYIPVFTMPSGYPPPDKGLRDWFETLSHSSDQTEAAEWFRGFLYSLLRVTLEKLKLLDGSVLVHNHPDQSLTAVRIP